jgi:uncharacterized membrane protein
MIDPKLHEWLNLFLRWFHVVAGVLWLGQTAFFSWLDARMTVEEADADGKNRVWMVHSGGFYVVEKQKAPELMPRTLHWFKWEATASWFSGIFLLMLVYYMGGSLLDYDSEMSLSLAISLGVGTLIVGWVVYDLLWISPLAKYERPLTFFSFLLAVAVAWGLAQVFSGRAAYIHVGALFGTVMAANVWVRILPAQRRMLASLKSGEPPDLTLGERAKQRSGHNTFLALPLIFIMISSHFPTVSYGHRLGWVMLVGFTVFGFAVRWVMSWWNNRQEESG